MSQTGAWLRRKAPKGRGAFIVTSIICLGLGWLTGEAYPQSTKEDHIACVKKKWIEDMQKFMETKNKTWFRNYIENKKCVFIKGGLKVTITAPPGIFGRFVGFRYKGTEYWAFKDSIIYKK